MMLSETPRRKRVTLLVNWGHWFALLNMLIAIVIAAIYILNSPAPGTFLGTFFLLTNWLSHIGLLIFFGFVIFILPLCYWLPSIKAVKTTASIVAAVALALLAFDALLYNKYGVHLSLNSADLIRNEAQTAIAEFGWQQWGFLSLLFLAWLSFQIIVANALWQRIERIQKFKLALPITSIFVLSFITSHALHIWADARLYQPIVQQDNMFPLSYPATAKTLMAKYSLLDIENYQQRRKLQFSQGFKGIKYPSEPVYCAVSPEQKFLLLIQDPSSSTKAYEGLVMQSAYLVSQSSAHSTRLTTLFSLPEIYHANLEDQVPLLLDLPRQVGLNVGLYSEQEFSHAKVAGFANNWKDFKQKVSNTESDLAIGFVSTKQAQELLSLDVVQHYQVLLIANSSETPALASKIQIHSNLALPSLAFSAEDYAPTILNAMGCKTPSKAYSTGRNLQKPERNWLVTSKDHKVLVVREKQGIEILSNGNVKTFDLVSGEETFDKVETDLLGQAIKRLSSFSLKK